MDVVVHPPAASTTTTSIRVFHDIPSLRSYCRQLLQANESVALVPTMGALHAGHLSLVRQAAQDNRHVFVSIYVNPTQFGPNEDLASYPRTWEADLQALRDLDVELAGRNHDAGGSSGRISGIFAPATKTMYPTLPPASSDLTAQGSFVTITPLSSLLEGASRPGFFRGVTTVCMKLFHIMTPDRVYFGQKDVQQTIVVKRMVRDFCMDIDVRVGSTVRDPDGLALSSRNVYLGERRRKVAGVLYAALRCAEGQFLRAGKRQRNDILDPALELLSSTAQAQARAEPHLRARFELDYLSLADPDTLEELDVVDDEKGAVLSAAIKMLPVEAPPDTNNNPDEENRGSGGGTTTVRLLDNIILLPPGSSERK